MLLIPLTNTLDPVHTFCKWSGNIVRAKLLLYVTVIKSMNANKKFSIKTMNLILQNYNLSYVVIRGLFPLSHFCYFSQSMFL